MARGADAGATTTSELAAVASRAAAGDLDAAHVLRAAGPAGLSALLDAGVAEAGRGDDATRAIDERAIDPRALDLVCAQVDCAASHLYWYTDFAAARAEAERSGKPIVVLRLLGRLDEQLSCANSRYFRLVLYSDPSIAGWLREHAVLYWTSERPVPKVTVDFGDGRRLVGTVTGNSIHYMLDPHGRIVDGMPGLHTPQRFLAWLQDASQLATRWAPLPDARFVAVSHEEHAHRYQQILDDLVGELTERGWSKAAALEAWGEPEKAEQAANPTAGDAARLALSKGVAERPLLAAMGASPTFPAPSNAVASLVPTQRWGARISPESRRLIVARAPSTADDDVNAAMMRLEVRLAEDGLRNEAFLHRRIHDILSRTYGLWSWQDLNDWVYTTLFLTPTSDPWLGLEPTELLWAVAPVAPAAESGGRP
ncbi:MAG TPA: hypothetical protein VGS57_01615 [Thermoanaerobaculia bacterium]|nr:hypothetical protein [Thermoanaerobaculia bacterium]